MEAITYQKDWCGLRSILLHLFKLFTVGSFCRETRSRSGIERERIDPGCVEDGEAQRSWYKVRTTKKLHCRAKSRSST